LQDFENSPALKMIYELDKGSYIILASIILTLFVINSTIIGKSALTQAQKNEQLAKKESNAQFYRQLETKANDENFPEFKVKELYLYPIRGLQGMKV